jgi:hypothetical protein
VKVGLVFHWGVDVNDQVNVVDVDTTSGNVGGNQNLHCTLAKGRKVAVSSWLGQVSMEVHSGNTSVSEGLG